MTAHPERGGNVLFKQHPDNREALSSIESLSNDEVLSRLAKMNIVLLGIPGAGKTTLSEGSDSRNSAINHISVGDISWCY